MTTGLRGALAVVTAVMSTTGATGVSPDVAPDAVPGVEPDVVARVSVAGVAVAVSPVGRTISPVGANSSASSATASSGSGGAIVTTLRVSSPASGPKTRSRAVVAPCCAPDCAPSWARSGVAPAASAVVEVKPTNRTSLRRSMPSSSRTRPRTCVITATTSSALPSGSH